MEPQNVSDNLKSLREVAGSLDIKMEPDVSQNLSNQENVMVRIKVEEQALLEQASETNLYSDPHCDLGNMQVKEEILMELALDSNEVTSQVAEVDKVQTINLGMPIDNTSIVAKAENIDHEDVKKEMVMNEDSLVSYDYPSFDESVSMDSNDVAVLGNVETCLQEEIHIKPESFDGSEETQIENHNIKQETGTVTETHLISNKLTNTTSTVTNLHDGLIESQTTKTPAMEILPLPHGEVPLNKISNPEEILSTVHTSEMDCDEMFQLNSITGNVLSLEQEAYGLLEAKKSQINHQGAMHPCLKCSKEYKTPGLLKRHMAIHDSIEKRAMGILKGQLTKKANRKKQYHETNNDMITLETIKMEKCDVVDVKPEIKKEDYKCTCGNVFHRRSRMETCLRSHSDYADANPSHQCSTCMKCFNDKNLLASHRKRAHTKKFHCKFCPTDYNTRKELFKHLQAHQKVQLMEYKVISEVVLGKQKMRCFMCGKSYTELSDLKCHVMEDHTSPYSCMHCKNTFSKIIEFGDHMKTYHPDVEGQSVLDVLEAFSLLVKAWKCEECGLQFHEADKLALHQIEQHSPDIKADPQFQCEDCRRVFISQKGLTSHRRVHHSEAIEETEPAIKGIMCLECRKICKDMDALTSHMRLHSPERKYPCKFCDFRFSTPEKRKTHAELHTGDMKYVCFICEYQCSSENRLKQHRVSVKHLNMKEYLASGMAVAQEQSTTETSPSKSEVKSQDSGKDSGSVGERVPCDVCGDTFPSEREMQDHKQTHPFIEFPNEDKPTRIFFK